MTEDPIRCECCGKVLTGALVYLELDQRNNTFHDFGGIPPEKNQGGFPFGAACARKMRRQAKAKRITEALR